MPPDSNNLRRQIWVKPIPTASAVPRHCRPFRLPSGGLLDLGDNKIVTLSQNAIFQPACPSLPTLQPFTTDPLGTRTLAVDARIPFYASTPPLMYAIAAATIVSYMLVIILFITPRTFFVNGAGGGRFLGQRGIIGGTSGTSAIIGIGSRPWLQKVAALTVAISLTIATADSFRVAEAQYDAGYQDAAVLTDLVFEGLEIRIVRVISDTCLWFAQVQTLIRLFSRHKEKVIIKWTGFSLIVLDTIFTILNYFVIGNGKIRPRKFIEAIPAFNYLFALSLSLLYAAWVIYYSLSKRRYAFYHRNMRNIILVAILALAAVLVPVVFFVVDISQPNVAGWGNYVRWVGAAAASVVVWEWVERIEALERDENKDGILGREIFAGDEMLQLTPSTNMASSRPRRNHKKGGGRGNRGAVTSTGWNRMTSMASRYVGSHLLQKIAQEEGHRPGYQAASANKQLAVTTTKSHGKQGAYPVPPAPSAPPISRAETTSATSTVYVVHYHEDSNSAPILQQPPDSGTEITFTDQPKIASETSVVKCTKITESTSSGGWRRITDAFKQSRSSPPPEVAQARANTRKGPTLDENLVEKPDKVLHSGGFLKRLRPKKTPQVDIASLPCTVIPPPRRAIDFLVEAEEQLQRAESSRLQEFSASTAVVSEMGQGGYRFKAQDTSSSSSEVSKKMTSAAESIDISSVPNDSGFMNSNHTTAPSRHENCHRSNASLGIGVHHNGDSDGDLNLHQTTRRETPDAQSEDGNQLSSMKSGTDK